MHLGMDSRNLRRGANLLNMKMYHIDEAVLHLEAISKHDITIIELSAEFVFI